MQSIEADFRKKFKDRFNELRGEMTQAEFANYLGISRPTVGFYENGERIPDALTLRKIASRCNVPADYLLGITDTKIREYINYRNELGLEDEAIEYLKSIKRDEDLLYSISKDDDKEPETPFELAYTYYSKYFLSIFNHILTDEKGNFVIPMITCVNNILTMMKNIRGYQNDAFNTLEIPWKYDEFKKALKRFSEENDFNSAFMQNGGMSIWHYTKDIRYLEWDLYETQQEFAQRMISKMIDEINEIELKNDAIEPSR